MQMIWQDYKADLGKGDVTTQWFLSKPHQIVRAQVIAKEPGIFAGLREAEWFLKKLGIKIFRQKPEGKPFCRGEILLVLRGRADRILACERTLLNLLQRMSGVATATHRLVTKLPHNIKLLATRKTLWGALDKRAVIVGGGGPHRLGLDDAVLIKDNHLALTNDLRSAWLRVLKKAKNIKFIEIELGSLKEVKEFASVHSLVRSVRSLDCSARGGSLGMTKGEALDDKKGVRDDNGERRVPIVVMLDNFKPAQVQAAVELLRPTGVRIEVSGGIHEQNIRRYAIPGVHFISSGAITNKAEAIDMSLNVILRSDVLRTEESPLGVQ